MTKKEFSLGIHPAAAIFPMVSDEEMKELASSIVSFGLREKIGTIVDDNGDVVVLDGRNRAEALRRIGVKDDVIISEFTEPINLDVLRATPEEYVLMANINRRNLNTTQRRALAGKLAVMYAERQKELPKEEQEDSLSKAAAAAGVSRRTAATAKKQVLAGPAKGPAKKKASAKKPKPGIGQDKVLSEIKTLAEAVNKSGHNFTVTTLAEIETHADALSKLARSKIDFINTRNREKLAAATAAGKKEVAEMKERAEAKKAEDLAKIDAIGSEAS